MAKFNVFAIIEGFPLDKNLEVNFKFKIKESKAILKPLGFKKTEDIRASLIELVEHTDDKISSDKREEILSVAKNKLEGISSRNPLTLFSLKDLEVSHDDLERFEKEFTQELNNFLRITSFITRFPSRLRLMICVKEGGEIRTHIYSRILWYENLPGYNVKDKTYSFNLSEEDIEFFLKLTKVEAIKHKKFIESHPKDTEKIILSDILRCLSIFKENLRNEKNSISPQLDKIRDFWTILTILSKEHSYKNEEKKKKQKELNKKIHELIETPELISQFKENQDAWYRLLDSGSIIKRIGLLFKNYKMEKEFKEIKPSWDVRSDWEHNRILIETSKRKFYAEKLEEIVSKILRKYIEETYDNLESEMERLETKKENKKSSPNPQPSH